MLRQSLYLLFFHLIPRLLATLPNDGISLLAFKAKADIDNKLIYTGSDYCKWHGVTCSRNLRVRYYVIDSFGIRGTLAAACALDKLGALQVLSLRNNSLFGPIPDFSSLHRLKTLFLDHNYFSGTFPISLIEIHTLSAVDLSHNTFVGPIPENLTSLVQLRYLRLEDNHFSGRIPPLSQPSLVVLSIANNNLSGPIPETETLNNFGISSFLNNPNLCGKTIYTPCTSSNLPPPPKQESGQVSRKDLKLSLWLIASALILSSGILIMVALILMRKRRREEQPREGGSLAPDSSSPHIKTRRETQNFQTTNCEIFESMKGGLSNRVSVNGSLVFCAGEEEVYTLEDMMLASADLLGTGTIATTYRVLLKNDLILCVKRLHAFTMSITSDDVFAHHINAVGRLRHPNLVPVRAFLQANQERLIVSDYMSNGSLFNFIHGFKSTKTKRLHLATCFKIATEVARGLAYLHHTVNFVHGNLKSSNVLLGSDYQVCITDYCLSILLESSTHDITVENEDGYTAPEMRNFALTTTAKSDVYAFGMLLLEVLTGNPPSQHPKLTPLELLSWVRMMRGKEVEDNSKLEKLVKMVSLCTVEMPEERPTMWQLVRMIVDDKDL